MKEGIKKQNFLSHFFAIGFGTIVNMFLGLITTPIITRVVDPDEYGQLSMFNTYTNIAVMVLCLGLDQALVRFYYEKEDYDYKKSLLKFCFLLPFAISLFGSFVVITVAFIKGDLLDFKPLIVVFLCINIVVTLWNRLALLILRLEYKSRKYAISNITHRVVYLLAILALISTINNHYFVLLIIASWISLLVSSIIAVFFAKNIWSVKTAKRLDNGREILRYSLPFILSMGLTTIFQACDRISIKYYCSYSDVGVYSSALTLVSVFAIIQTTFNTLWSPMMIKHFAINPDDKSFIRKGNKYITIIMFLFGFFLILAKDIFALLLGEKYREAAYIMPFLIFSPIMYTVSETTQAGIEYSKKSYHNITISLAACIVNITGNMLLVPFVGSKGAAISTGLSYIVFFIMRTVISNYYYKVDFQLWKMAIMISVLICYAYYNTFYSFGSGSVLGFVLCVGILLTLYSKDVKGLLKFAVNELKPFIK